MNKRILVFVMSALYLVSIIGCASTPKEQAKVQEPTLAQELANAPKWVLNPALAGGLSAVGSAKIGKAGMQFARSEAMAHARDELVRVTSIKVKNMVKNFAQTTGIGDTETVDKVSSDVSRQVANETLSGSKHKDTWISPGGDLYVLVVVDDNIAKNAIKAAVQTSYQNQEALWQKFQAKQANEELDREIEKEMSAKK